MDHGSHAAHAPADLIAHLLSAAEDDGFEGLIRRVAKDVHQSLLLLESPAHLNRLRDVFIRHECVGIADVDLDRVREDRGGDAHDRAWPRRGEEQSLALRRRSR